MFFRGPVKDWWLQRVTAFISVPVVFYVLFAFLYNFSIRGSQVFFDSLFTRPVEVSLFLILVFFLLIHSLLGLRVIISDYVQSACVKLVIFLFLDFISCFTFLFFIVAVFLESQVFS